MVKCWYCIFLQIYHTHMKTLFTQKNRHLSMKVVMIFLLVLAAYVQSSAQGYLKNSSTTTHTNGITITEVAGYGNPSHDWNGDGGSPNSNSDEFVELTNNSTDSIDISGWIIGDNLNNYFFPSGTILGPGKKAVIFQRSTTFGNATPSSLQAGPTNFNPGDSNYAFQWGTGIANGGDVVAWRHAADGLVKLLRQPKGARRVAGQGARGPEESR